MPLSFEIQIVFLCLFGIPVAAVQSDLSAKGQSDLSDEKNRPVSKVTALLKDMTEQLEKEGEEDEEIYEKMGCWCVTNEKSKTKSIANAETEIETLTATIESLTAQSSKLNTEIANLDQEVAKNTEDLATATSVREKESAEFIQEEKEAVVSIGQLKAAVIALSKAHDSALIKKVSKVGTIRAKKLEFSHSGVDKNFAKTVEAEAMSYHLHHIIARHPNEFLEAFLQVNHKFLKPSQRKGITAFLQTHTNIDSLNFDDLPEHFVQSSQPIDRLLQTSDSSDAFVHHEHHGSLADKVREYAESIQEQRGIKHTVSKQSLQETELPASIQSLIHKVLKGDTGLLETSLDDSEAGEARYEPASGAIFGILKQMKENFETNLKQSQEAEAKAADEFDQLKAAKEKEIKTSTDVSNTKKDELATTDEKNAESKEIVDDTSQSLAADQAFLADLKDRCANMDKEFEERTKGRQLEIEAVSKALAFLNSDEAHDLFTRTFNQPKLFLQMHNQRHTALRKMLKASALKFKDARLLKLASKVSMEMNPAFKKVKAELDLMVDKLTRQQKDEVKKRDYCIEAFNTNERDVGMKERDKDDLEALIDDLKMTIGTLDKEIENLKAEIANLEIELKEASENRKKENAEFTTTVADQRATQKLLAIALKILSDFYKPGGFLQTGGGKAGQAPPPGFKSYEKSAASGGVMGMMQGIIDDAKGMEAECIRAEEQAQKDFDDFKKDTENAIETKTTDIETKSEDKAKAESDKAQADVDVEATITELENLANEEHALHKECDFVLKNFEITQAARDAEIESLKQANQIFSGASFKSFLQY